MAEPFERLDNTRWVNLRWIVRAENLGTETVPEMHVVFAVPMSDEEEVTRLTLLSDTYSGAAGVNLMNALCAEERERTGTWPGPHAKGGITDGQG